MKVKTAELDGLALDCAVAKCEDKNGVLHDDGITRCIVIAAPSGVYKGRYTPTVNWAQGGPIIEREGITLRCGLHGWDAELEEFDAISHEPTPLIAAMRCLVVSKLGDEVDVPEELM